MVPLTDLYYLYHIAIQGFLDLPPFIVVEGEKVTHLIVSEAPRLISSKSDAKRSFPADAFVGHTDVPVALCFH